MPAPSPFGLPGPGPVLCPAFGDAGTAGGSVPAGTGEGVEGGAVAGPCSSSPASLGRAGRDPPAPAECPGTERAAAGRAPAGTGAAPRKRIKRVKSALRHATGRDFSFPVAAEEASISPY